MKLLSANGMRVILFFLGILAGILINITGHFPQPERTVGRKEQNLSALDEQKVTIPLPEYPLSSPQPGIFRLAQIETDRPERSRFGMMKYTVKEGDTAWSIAQKFNLRMESILWGNEAMSADAGSLRVGQEINILPEDGVLYTVQKEDTWEIIEYRNGVPRQKIIEYMGNPFWDRSSSNLIAGEQLIIPGGRKPIVWLDPGPRVEPGKGRKSAGFYSGPLVNMGTGVYIIPVSPVRITQPYWDGHPALDYDTVTGQPIYAADSGTVIYSGWSESGYGNLIIIDHGTGYWTYYGHNDVNLVDVGQGVVQGQQIARSGNTGRSSGDHLDFRIRVAGGAFIDPTPLMPKQ